MMVRVKERRMQQSILIAKAVRGIDAIENHPLEIVMRTLPPSANDPRPGKMTKHTLNVNVVSTLAIKTVIVKDVAIEP